MSLSRDDRAKAERFKEIWNNAGHVLIGAGAGLSAAAGFTYAGERFRKYFSDFERKYGFHDMYSGGFYPFESLEEYWAYWSMYVFINRYRCERAALYDKLFASVKDKDYFVLTTNVDHCFQKAGFDKKRLFYTQGDYGLFQCSVPCHEKTYDNETVIRRMVQCQKDMKIPSSLVPRCPVCGKPMTMNLRIDDTFVQDGGWYAARERYADFLKKHEGKEILFLELGVGGNTPSIIKYPFWGMAFANKRSRYVCVGLDGACVPEQIADRSVCFAADIADVLAVL